MEPNVHQTQRAEGYSTYMVRLLDYTPISIGFSDFDDPMLALKKRQQLNSVIEYYCEFSLLFHHFQLWDPLKEK